MQIDLIETFLDLVETRSFNRTADRLGLTQSTVSGRVAALEAAVGMRLFLRSRAGTELTTEGLKFESHARTLRHAWAEAKRAVQNPTEGALSLRIGVQNDLATRHIGDLVQEFRARLPDCAIYVEPDFSNQMCNDLAQGVLDFAVLYTPRALPDLHFASLGEVRYRLISSDTANRKGLTAARYIHANYAPAFDAVHRQLLPDLAGAPLASGQNSAVASLLSTLGGSAFVLEDTARQMVAEGRFQMVSDVPAIAQPVFAAMHLRHRTARLHQHLQRIVTRAFATR